jgi:hypothetical protein
MGDAPLPAHEILLNWWQSTQAGIETRAVPSAEIQSLEERYGVHLPASFRAYLLNASPVSDPSWDHELTNWWPFESLQSVAEGYEWPLAEPVAGYEGKLILFADFSIWCWAWAINCAPGADYGKIMVIGGGERFVADGFDEFATKYIHDWASVAP